MISGSKMTPVEKEWALLLRSEARFLKQREKAKQSFVNEQLKKVVPEKLRETKKPGCGKRHI